VEIVVVLDGSAWRGQRRRGWRVVLVNKEHKTERVLQRVAIEPADQRQTLLCPSDQTQGA